MNDDEIVNLFHTKLFEDLSNEKNAYPDYRPLLAHYTSIESLENILKSGEVWFSNPLYMNDLEELRFIMFEAHKRFNESKILKENFTELNSKLMLDSFNLCFDNFTNEHALDVYAFCLSEHNKEDNDGKLSMWRGYGGNGGGVAIVFDSAKFGDGNNSAMIISRVEYSSKNERIKWIDDKILEFIELVKKQKITPEKFYLATNAFFQRILTYALFTKHKGFKEEDEWRIVYLKYWFFNHELKDMLGYKIGKRGIEPKFILPIKHIEGVIQEGITLENIVDRIILGPTISNQLTFSSVKRMLLNLNKHSLAEKLVFSEIPFREI